MNPLQRVRAAVPAACLGIATLAILSPAHAAAPNIQITEISYGGLASGAKAYPGDAGDGEYIELTNVGDAPQDFTGWKYAANKSATMPTAGTIDLSSYGSVAPGESVIITDLTPADFRTEWNLKPTVKVINDGAATINGGPDAVAVFDGGGTLVDSLSYAAGFMSAKGVAAWANPGHLADVDTATPGAWTSPATAGDAEGSWTSANGAVGSPGASTFGTSTPSDVRNAGPVVEDPHTVVTISAVDAAAGTVTLSNSGTSSHDVSGWTITDAANATYAIAGGTTIAAGGTVTVSTGLAFDTTVDTATLADGSTVVSTKAWNNTPPSGNGDIKITEVAYGGKITGAAGDGEYVELTNVGTTPQSFAGWTYTGKDGAGTLPLDDFGTVGPGESVIITDVTGTEFRADWGLPGTVKVIDDKANGLSVTLDKGPDTPTIYDAQGAVVDKMTYAGGYFPGKGSSAWVDAAHLGAQGDTTGWTISTVGDAEDSWTSASGSIGSPGKTTFGTRTPDIKITEVAYGGNIAGSTGDGEYLELTNVGTAPQSFAGWTYNSNNSKGVAQPLPLDDFGTVAPGESVLITDVTPAEFRTEWSLPDTVKIINDKANGLSVTLDKGPDSPTIYDGTGAVVDSMTYQSGFFSGKGVSAWVDSAHLGARGDTTGWTISTAGDVEGSTTSAGGAIGSPGTYVSASASSGDLGSSTGGGGSHPGPGVSPIPSLPWPGPQTVTTADTMDFGQNMSGLFYVAGATPAQDYMWGVENGDSGAPLNTGGSTLWKLVRDANGNWGPAPGWESGIRLHYADGTGNPDAEGVTAVGGKVFVSTERDNNVSNVSRVSILQYDPNTLTSGALNAVSEWDLADLEAGSTPILSSPADANLGAEATTFIPDSYLVANGFKTDSGELYDPSKYGDHNGGVFFAGIEKNGNVYGYVLEPNKKFTRVSTFSSGFNTIMDAMWDPSQDALWLDCDNTCDGQTSIVKLNTTPNDPNQGHFEVKTVYDRPTGGPNVNNEGFTAQPASECDPVTNTRSVWWSDDSDDAGHAFRTATVTCATPIPGQIGASISVAYTQKGTSTPAVANGNGGYTTPVTATFTCLNLDAVLNQPCPAPVDIAGSQAATTVATLTDTLGTVYPVSLPAITIGSGDPTGNPSGTPTGNPTGNPTGTPTANPTGNPTSHPTGDTGAAKAAKVKKDKAAIATTTKAIAKAKAQLKKAKKAHKAAKVKALKAKVKRLNRTLRAQKATLAKDQRA